MAQEKEPEVKLHELLNPKVLLEGKQLLIFKDLLPSLLITEENIPSIFRPGGTGMNVNFWFDQLHGSLLNLAIASNIQKRLKEIGVHGVGAKRVDKAVQSAAKATRYLLSNPGATAYKIPVWSTKNTLPKPVIKKWNEAFERAFRDELSRIELTE